MIPSTAFQLIRIGPATAWTLASFSHPITSASNWAVYLELPSAQGTRTVTTPCSGHRTRGTLQTRKLLWPQASRFRHSRRRVS